MILDRLENAERYIALHPAFAAAFDFLKSAGPETLAVPRHELDGERVYVLVDRKEGRTRDGARLEVHRKYVDIQFAVGGTDAIGWKPLGDCTDVAEDYDAGKDVAFFADRPQTWAVVPPGTFAIFFPEDAHAPLGGTGPLTKLIAKVAAET